MGAGTIQPVQRSTSFTIVAAANQVESVLDGDFVYNGDGTTVKSGILTSFHEFTTDSTPVAIADFTGLSVDAPSWINDVQQEAAGNKTAVETLTSTFSYNFIGGAGPDSLGSAGPADTLSGTGKDVFDSGGPPPCTHETNTGGPPAPLA